MNKADKYITLFVLAIIVVKVAGYIRTDLTMVDYYISGVTKSIALYIAVLALSYAVKETIVHTLVLSYAYIQLVCCAIYIGAYSGYTWVYSLSYILILTLIIVLVIFGKGLKEYIKGWEHSFKQREL